MRCDSAKRNSSVLLSSKPNSRRGTACLPAFCSSLDHASQAVIPSEARDHSSIRPSRNAWPCSRTLSFAAANLVKIRRALQQPPFRPVVHRILRPFPRLISIPPQRRASVYAIPIQGVEINMKRRQLFLVVVVIPCHSVHCFQARVGR